MEKEFLDAGRQLVRILFVNEKAGFFGGVEQNVADAAAALRARGHHVALAFEHGSGRNERAYLDVFDSSFRDPSAVSRFSADVVFVHKTPKIVPWLRVSREMRRPARIVRMVHDHDLCCPRAHKYFLLSGRVCHHAAGVRCYADLAFLKRQNGGVAYAAIGERLAEMRRNQSLDALLVASEFMRDQLLRNGFSSERVKLLPPCVRGFDAAPAPPAEARNILYVGQTIRGKGVDLLLRACLHLRGNFHLDVVGDGNARESLQAMAERIGLGSRVTFHGWMQPDRLAPFYAEARMVVVPSRWPEPFGLVGLEAMGQGRAVVAFRVGGIPDWLVDGETGFLAEEQDVRGFASRMQHLLDDREQAAAMGLAGWRRAREQYGFEAYVTALEALLAGERQDVQLAG